MGNPQLRLVTDPAPTFHPRSSDAARRIFEHWLALFGRSPARCKLGPTRRAAIAAALAMGYDEDQLCQAIEGMAADPLERASAEHIRERMRELEWMLGAEARIEHWSALGLELRAELERAGAAPAQPQQPADAPPTAEQVAAAMAKRAALAERARQMRQGCA